MMTYEEYQSYIISYVEESRETRRKQHDEYQQLEMEINRRMSDARRRFLEEQASLRIIQRDRAKAISDKWKAERTRLYLEQAKVVNKWREQNGMIPRPQQESGNRSVGDETSKQTADGAILPPPYVELPEERPNEIGG